MALRLPAPKAAEFAIASIGCGYDITADLRLKYRKGGAKDSRLIEIDEGGVERLFCLMSEQFNQEMSLTGKIPSGLFNSMFEFTGCWQKDAANTKTLAFDGVSITLYTVALEKSQLVLRDHVKKAVPSSWEPSALAKFIEMFGTHIIVGVKMGGKDVIYVKQQHSSVLQPADLQKTLKEMADKRFSDTSGQYSMASEQVYQNKKLEIREQRLRFADTSSSSSYSHKELPRQWAPVFSELPLGPQRKRQNTASLQFSLMGPKLFVNVTPVDVGKRPVTGLRLYLEGKRSNRLAIHLQHLSSLPNIFQLADDPHGNFHQESYDHKYYEKVQWKNFSHVCTAPVESDEELSIVTGAQLQVENSGFKNILFLRLRFSTVLGATIVKHPEWDGSPGLAPKSGLISTLISHHFTSVQKPPPRPADVNINSAVYPGGPQCPFKSLSF
ncbi:hypothetical protein GH714_023109 [Hevea brasiliensis]|uniref:MACPF domain-containing protein n=1 Tax=Hevea brasiliensis TaxID=3981 RepID=A0A6A6N7B3_HEVBR|nr:hypothetical protein GH714_023109 [Hevea brasiliensis]